jgi:hypothetical protein
MLMYLKKNTYWQVKQIISLTYYYNYENLVFKRWRIWTYVKTNIVVQVLSYMYKNWYKFWIKLTIYF